MSGVLRAQKAKSSRPEGPPAKRLAVYLKLISIHEFMSFRHLDEMVGCVSNNISLLIYSRLETPASIDNGIFYGGASTSDHLSPQP